MRLSSYLMPTLREVPGDVALASQQLMLRAGLVRRTPTGPAIWLPPGLRALRKVEAIVRQELEAAGAQEIGCPLFDPDAPAPDLVPDLAHALIASYRDGPVALFTLDRRSRHEPRPRTAALGGLDPHVGEVFTFDATTEALEVSYTRMYQAFRRIFARLCLNLAIVATDPGADGPCASYEFVVELGPGGTEYVRCTRPGCGHAATLEAERCVRVEAGPFVAKGPPAEISTPGVRRIDDLSAFLAVGPETIVKTLICEADGAPVAVLLRGDHELSEAKLVRLLGCRELAPASPAAILAATGGPVGFSGPIGLAPGVRLFADRSVEGLGAVVIGANRADTHLVNAVAGTDFPLGTVADLRRAVASDPCPECKTPTEICRGTAVGRVARTGPRTPGHEAGASGRPLLAGHHEIALDLALAAIVERHHDAHGLVWPLTVAPFQVGIVPINMNDLQVVSTAIDLHRKLSAKGLDVLLDDRDARAGVKFADAELAGAPVRITVSTKTLADREVEWTTRRELTKNRAPVDGVVDLVAKHLSAEHDRLVVLS